MLAAVVCFDREYLEPHGFRAGQSSPELEALADDWKSLR
jgi:hypothetical protein